MAWSKRLVRPQFRRIHLSKLEAEESIRARAREFSYLPVEGRVASRWEQTRRDNKANKRLFAKVNDIISLYRRNNRCTIITQPRTVDNHLANNLANYPSQNIRCTNKF